MGTGYMSGLMATDSKVSGGTVSGMDKVRTPSEMATNLSANTFTEQLKDGANITGPTVTHTQVFSKMVRSTAEASGEKATLRRFAIRMRVNLLMT